MLLVDFNGALLKDAVNKGFFKTSRFPALQDSAKTYYNSVY